MSYRRRNKEERLKRALKFAKRFGCKLVYFDGQEFGEEDEPDTSRYGWSAEKYAEAVKIVANIRKALAADSNVSFFEKDEELLEAVKSMLTREELSRVAFASNPS